MNCLLVTPGHSWSHGLSITVPQAAPNAQQPYADGDPARLLPARGQVLHVGRAAVEAPGDAGI